MGEKEGRELPNANIRQAKPVVQMKDPVPVNQTAGSSFNSALH